MAKTKDVTVYIGRFNPFHNGHAHVLHKALKSSKLVIVLIGSSFQARSLKNPFTYTERLEMIAQWYSHEKWIEGSNTDFGALRFVGVHDHPYSNNAWIEEIQNSVNKAIKAYCSENSDLLIDVTLTGSDRDNSTWYLHSFPQWKVDLVPEFCRTNKGSKTSATSVRETLYETKCEDTHFEELHDRLPLTTRRFLSNFANDDKKALSVLREEYSFVKSYKQSWALAPYAPTFVTADAVVIQSGHVLVVRRGANPGKGLLALPGGFVKQNQRVQEAAVEEIIEETGIRLATGKKAVEITRSMLNGSIKAKEIFDNPDRSSRGRTITTAFLIRLDDTKPLPKVKGQNMPLEETGGVKIVETLDAFWMPLNEALSKTNIWFEDHHAMLAWAASIKD